MNNSSIEYITRIIVEKVTDIMETHIKKIIIYGSYARGDYNDDSDIDVALLIDEDRISAKKYDDRLMDMVASVAMDVGENIEYICLPIDEFEEKKSWYGFFKNINNEGLVIYG